MYARDKVRFELMRRFGYFVTESSEHNAEYVPVLPQGRRTYRTLRRTCRRVRKAQRGEPRSSTPRPVASCSPERTSRWNAASSTARSSSTRSSPARRGPSTATSRTPASLRTSPTGCCVEVPILVDDTGLRPCHVGDLPPQCAATCAPHTAVQNLTVRAALEGRRDHVYHAAMLDRHAASVLSLDEIAAMVDELIVAHGDAMPEGVRTSGAEAGRI